MIKKSVGYRCKRCSKLLFIAFLFTGKIELKCPRCKSLNLIISNEPQTIEGQLIEEVKNE